LINSIDCKEQTALIVVTGTRSGARKMQRSQKGAKKVRAWRLAALQNGLT